MVGDIHVGVPRTLDDMPCSRPSSDRAPTVSARSSQPRLSLSYERNMAVVLSVALPAWSAGGRRHDKCVQRRGA